VIVAATVGLLLLFSYLEAYSPSRLQSSSSSSTASSSASSGSAYEIELDYLAHLESIEAKNVSLIMEAYQNNATVKWEGATSGQGGDWKGFANVTALYNGALPSMNGLAISNMSETENSAANGAEVNGSLYAKWYILPAQPNCPSNEFYGQVLTDVSYAYSSGRWLISTEIWNFQAPVSSGVCA